MQGSRCRLCARVYAPRDPLALAVVFCGGNHCKRFPPEDVDFSNFATHCCNLQNWFLDDRRHRVAPCSALSSLSTTESWWWEKINLAWQQCEWSLIRLAPLLEQMLENRWSESLGGPIREIRELKIMPSIYYWFRHCSFLVNLVGHGWWVFDPTGVQFGPDWPLLSPYNEYRLRARERPGLEPWMAIMSEGLGASFGRRAAREEPF
ncbi:hypothetical protein SVAN01_03268 [Stagonosporopsis vannaccii]|nr:hypothetical protein SVAN01_03268 [Stagonosporopsis vannaccii]